MMILIGAALAAGTGLLVWISRQSGMASRIFDGIAVAAAFLFFVTAADALAQTLLHDTVFMTEVHRVLANPVFLTSGAYLGPYVMARIAVLPVYLFGPK
ncbi:hypothetical protein FHS16_000120 [Paenibacillus endophyticus]|uniref:Uncharacterized protein n=1 Tax=Paenibacillus endophyticus TaxID=1294268 RepID=A0A7W5C312_9BACL|nr:hypothetical protein [Paenibacillus endophyticus]MBB3150088.1 hypothetical protein [Paenibacillus endophyticus]